MNGPVHYHLGGFPPSAIDWARLVPLIGQANAALARYDGLLSATPNAAVLNVTAYTQPILCVTEPASVTHKCIVWNR